METRNVHRERELFALIAEGNEAAFEQLFNLYVPEIQKIVFPIVQSETAVKDIAQEVFLYIWLGRDKLPEVEVPQRWIFKIAYNQSFLYLKKKSLQEKVRTHIGMEETPAMANDTEHAVAVSEVSRLIGQGIAALPAQGRKIFEMSRISGMKPAEIAEALDISVQGVRNSLTRSAKFIREYLEQQGIQIPLILIIYFLNC